MDDIYDKEYLKCMHEFIIKDCPDVIIGKTARCNENGILLKNFACNLILNLNKELYLQVFKSYKKVKNLIKSQEKGA
ncbi:hypothetical protein ciss_21460 [Carboxydothermus islandicus]|uniref:Uncharacterized protein n=1 Tax=Carboxydothermus islandicus TaxID=661089 RepID=A0A1L8D4W6_9THEO|nr:hypothetical protein [Carboxydothermus islandicus]GAV26213.1 hypothetical protein ciss_21460 [Carboxydothermus islandicus]